MENKLTANLPNKDKPEESTKVLDDWQLSLNDSIPFDPLLSSLLIIAKLNNIPTTAEAIIAGLPLEKHRLTPELFKRAAGRIGLSARIVHFDLSDIQKQRLPMPIVLLLKNSQVCVLTDLNHGTGEAQIIQPEAGEGYSKTTLEELAKNYTGFVIFVKKSYRFDAETAKLAKPHGAKNWFWGAMGKTIPFYMNVLIASLLINIFSLASTIYILNVYDRVIPNAAIPTLWVLSIGVAIVYIFDFLMRNLRAFFIDSVGRGVDAEISHDTFEHLVGLELAHAPTSSATLVNAINNFEFFREFITSASIALLIDIPFAVIFIMVMVYLGGSIAIVPVITIPVIIFLSFITQTSLEGSVDEANQYSRERHKILIESLGNIETLKSISAEGTMQKKWGVVVRQLGKLNARMRMLANIGVNASGYVNQIALVAVIIVGAYKVAAGQITTGALIACVILIGHALYPVSQVAVLLTRYRQAKIALKSLDDVMQMPTEREDIQAFLHRPTLTGSIEFKNVSFNYPNQMFAALDNISFRINPGDKIAIIGHTGSGKSTIIRLILKLYAATAGNVLIDGIEIQQMDPAELRHHVAYVPQDVMLFHGTIRENISIAAPYVEDTTILRALKMSGLDSFVTTHPQGLDRLVSDRGQNLSGGQRQAVAIARALLLDKPILILDEPSTSMDDAVAMAFMHNVKNNYGDKTIILVTHQFPLLQLVDRIIVVSGGRIVLDDTRDAVLEKLRVPIMKVQPKQQQPQPETQSQAQPQHKIQQQQQTSESGTK